MLMVVAMDIVMMFGKEQKEKMRKVESRGKSSADDSEMVARARG